MPLPKFDYVYNPADWDETQAASDIDQLDSYVEEGHFGEIIEFATLIQGPPIFAVLIPTTFDEEGEPDETEVQHFATREEALAAYREAMAKKP